MNNYAQNWIRLGSLLWTRADGDLGRWVHWLLTTYMRRSLCHHGHCDRDWQGNSGP